MSTPTNTAAWLPSAKTIPFSIETAPLGSPAANEILVKNHAIAINPIDTKLQYLAIYPLSYPTILGQDVAGEVVAVGPEVTRFKVGDRVTGCAAGFATKKDTDKAFQAYTILESCLTSEIPEVMGWERAVVMPLGCATASAGLFGPDLLGMQVPTEPKSEGRGKTLVVWGGASSVGSNAIQLAVAAGYEVISTASEKNFGFVKNLGASQVFDYHSPTVVEDMVSTLQQNTLVGIFDAIGGQQVWTPCIEILQKLLRTSSAGKAEEMMIATINRNFPTPPPAGIGMKFVASLSIRDNHVGTAVFQDFLPKALKNGSYVAAPEPLVVEEKGLKSLQKGIDLLREGVSAKKIVVLL